MPKYDFDQIARSYGLPPANEPVGGKYDFGQIADSYEIPREGVQGVDPMQDPTAPAPPLPGLQQGQPAAGPMDTLRGMATGARELGRMYVENDPGLYIEPWGEESARASMGRLGQVEIPYFPDPANIVRGIANVPGGVANMGQFIVGQGVRNLATMGQMGKAAVMGPSAFMPDETGQLPREGQEWFRDTSGLGKQMAIEAKDMVVETFGVPAASIGLGDMDNALGQLMQKHGYSHADMQARWGDDPVGMVLALAPFLGGAAAVARRAGRAPGPAKPGSMNLLADQAQMGERPIAGQSRDMTPTYQEPRLPRTPDELEPPRPPAPPSEPPTGPPKPLAYNEAQRKMLEGLDRSIQETLEGAQDQAVPPQPGPIDRAISAGEGRRKVDLGPPEGMQDRRTGTDRRAKPSEGPRERRQASRPGPDESMAPEQAAEVRAARQELDTAYQSYRQANRFGESVVGPDEFREMALTDPDYGPAIQRAQSRLDRALKGERKPADKPQADPAEGDTFGPGQQVRYKAQPGKAGGPQKRYVIDTRTAKDGSIEYKLSRTKSGKGKTADVVWAKASQVKEPLTITGDKRPAPGAKKPASAKGDLDRLALYMRAHGGWSSDFPSVAENYPKLRNLVKKEGKGGKSLDEWAQQLAEDFPEEFHDRTAAYEWLDEHFTQGDRGAAPPGDDRFKHLDPMEQHAAEADAAWQEARQAAHQAGIEAKKAGKYEPGEHGAFFEDEFRAGWDGKDLPDDTGGGGGDASGMPRRADIIQRAYKVGFEDGKKGTAGGEQFQSNPAAAQAYQMGRKKGQAGGTLAGPVGEKAQQRAMFGETADQAEQARGKGELAKDQAKQRERDVQRGQGSMFDEETQEGIREKRADERAKKQAREKQTPMFDEAKQPHPYDAIIERLKEADGDPEAYAAILDEIDMGTAADRVRRTGVTDLEGDIQGLETAIDQGLPVAIKPPKKKAAPVEKKAPPKRRATTPRGEVAAVSGEAELAKLKTRKTAGQGDAHPYHGILDQLEKAAKRDDFQAYYKLMDQAGWGARAQKIEGRAKVPPAHEIAIDTATLREAINQGVTIESTRTHREGKVPPPKPDPLSELGDPFNKAEAAILELEALDYDAGKTGTPDYTRAAEIMDELGAPDVAEKLRGTSHPDAIKTAIAVAEEKRTTALTEQGLLEEVVATENTQTMLRRWAERREAGKKIADETRDQVKAADRPAPGANWRHIDPIKNEMEFLEAHEGRGIAPKNTSKSYLDAWEMQQFEGGALVHGRVLAANDKPLRAAWLEHGDKVYDPMSGSVLDRDLFYRDVKDVEVVIEPELGRKLTRAEASENYLTKDTVDTLRKKYEGEEPGPWRARLSEKKQASAPKQPTMTPEQIAETRKRMAEERARMPKGEITRQTPSERAVGPDDPFSGTPRMRQLPDVKRRRMRSRSKYRGPAQIVRLQEIVRDLERKVPELAGIRPGLKGKRNALGYFTWATRIIRTGKITDIPTIAHEIGHAVQKVLFPEWPELTKKGPAKYGMSELADAELEGLGRRLYGKRKPATSYQAEGLAEYLRLWITERHKAAAEAPVFDEIFRRRLKTDGTTLDLAAALDQAKMQFDRWNEQGATARVFSRIRAPGEKAPPTRSRWTSVHRLYAKLFESDWMLNVITHAMVGRGPKGPQAPLPKFRKIYGAEHPFVIGNPYVEGIGYRSHAGLAELMIERGGGVPDIKPNRLLGLVKRHNLDTSETGKLWDAPTREAPVEVHTVAKRLKESVRDGLVEYRKGDGFYLTEEGRASLTAEPYAKKFDALADILGREGVADEPLPFVREVSEQFKSASQAVKDRLARVLGRKYEELDSTRGLDTFKTYAVAKHGIELHQRGITRLGFTLKDAVATVRELETPQLKQALTDLNKFREFQIDMLVDEGLVSARGAAEMKKRYKWYVPFYRFFEDAAEQGARGGKKYADPSSPIKRIKGDELPIQDPIESIIADTYVFAEAIKRNRVRRSLAELAEEFPGNGWAVEKVPPKMVPIDFAFERVRKQITAILEGEGIDTKELGPWVDMEMLRIWRPDEGLAPDTNTVSYMVDGRRKFLKVDPELYRVLRGLDYEQTHWFLKILGPAARLVRAGVTLVPDFAIRNFIRDGIQGSMLSELGGVNPFSGFVMGRDQFGLSMKKRKRVKGFQSRMAGDDLWFKWKAAGGSQATLVALDKAYALFKDGATQRLRKVAKHPAIVKDLQRRGFELVTNPIDTMRAISELAEEGTRVGMFGKAIQHFGMDQHGVTEAMLRSRDATVDFARTGYWTESAARGIPFLNANLQGLDRFGRVLWNASRSPQKAAALATRVLAFATLPAIAHYLWWRASGRIEEYRELPAWQRNLFFTAPVGGEGNGVSIPRGFEVSVLFGSSVESFLDWMDTQDPRILDEWGEQLLHTVNPFMFPALFAGTLENWSNRRAYYDRPVIPQREEKLLAEEQYGPFTSETGKLIAAGARASARVPILSQAVSIAAGVPARDVSPRHIDSLISNLTGGLGTKYIVPALDLPVSAGLGGTELGEDIGITKVKDYDVLGRGPVARAVRGFYLHPEFRGRGRVDRFYDQVNESERAYRTFMQKKGEAQARFLKDPENWRHVVSYRVLQDVKRSVSSLNSQMAEAVRSNDKKAQRALQGELLKVIRRGEERVEAALEDPTANEAVEIDRELATARRQSTAVRAEAVTALERFIEAGDIPGAREFIKGLPLEHRKWARAYATKYRRKMNQSLRDRAIQRAPRKERIRLKREASGR